ncbi:hypothetical protein LguiA_017143 [Lonicera macranthoides]
MISLTDVYHVMEATVPLYVATILAYVCVKWWNLFTLDQCSAINKFAAKLSIPLLSFQAISKSNPYKMSIKLVFADFLQKLLAIFILAVTTKISSKGSLNWIITGISLSTLPNTLILGIPLLRAIYGNEAATLLAQIVVLQNIVWYNLLLFLFELRAAKEAFVTPPEATGEVEAPEEAQRKEEEVEEETKNRSTRKTNLMLILSNVLRKLITSPNMHATVLGLIWAGISFRWGVKLPTIVDKSISIMSDGGLGMAMFSLGLFIASEASLIACGTQMAVLAMAMKFAFGPALMTASSAALGLKGRMFRVAILQAALPQGIVPFVYAKEYNVHPGILSTGVIFGLLIALPVALAYYFLLAL